MINKESGITLRTLVILIIVLLILAGVSITVGTNMINVTKNNALTSELQMVQHAVLERYTQYKVINDKNLLEGNSITYQEVQNIANEIGVTLKDTDNYYELNPEDLKEIGIMKSEDTYIVNYETGEVINKTKLKTISGDALYTYAVE